MENESRKYPLLECAIYGARTNTGMFATRCFRGIAGHLPFGVELHSYSFSAKKDAKK